MTSVKDFETDGKVDWAAYRRAQVKAGETCYQCGQMIFYPQSLGHQRLCGECSSLTNQGEVYHSKLIRCPHCYSLIHTDHLDCDFREIFADGEHTIMCNTCEKDFQFTTQIEFTFVSPKRVDKDAEQETKETV